MGVAASAKHTFEFQQQYCTTHENIIIQAI